MRRFTSDWVSEHLDNWTAWLAPFSHKPNATGLEIGSYEGRSAIWFLEHILTGHGSHLTCIDKQHHECFDDNTVSFRDRLTFICGQSFDVLRSGRFNTETFDFAYVDGSHKAPDVLQDTVLVFPMIRRGGVMILDDYRWHPTDDETSRPQIAIDAFLRVTIGQYDVLHIGEQVALRKT
jgi:predicted O-methyltransferase YrrM